VSKLANRVWVISEVFYPDDTSTAYIMTEIALHLAKKSEVHVLCGPAGYSEKKNSTDYVLANLKIHRIKLFNFNKNKLIQRLLRLILLSLSFFFVALFKIRRKDKVLIVTNPAFSIPLFAFLKRLKSFKLYILVHDVFPENLIAAGVLKNSKGLLYKTIKKLFDNAYKKADKLFVLGKDMKEALGNKVAGTDNIVITENWGQTTELAPQDYLQNKLILENKLSDKMVFLFAGNLGRLQALEQYFEIIQQVNNPYIHFSFIGNGALLKELTHIKEHKQLTNVSFWGSFPRSEQNLFLNACTFGVVTLDERVKGLGVPSKSYNILATSKPIFYIGDQNTEIALLIEKYHCGLSYSWHEKEQIIDLLNSISPKQLESFVELGKRGRATVVEHYSKEKILEKFSNAILC